MRLSTRARYGLRSLLYLAEQDPGNIVPVREIAEQERISADYLEHLLTDKPYDPVKAFEAIVFQSTAQKFIQGDKPYLPKEDPIFCLQRDLFDLVLTVKRKEDALVEVLKMT